MAKLKIGLVLDTSLDPDDGVQQYVVGIGEWFRSQGHDVHYLVGQTERRQLPNIHSLAKNITVQFNGNRTTIPLPSSKRRLRRFLQNNHFDVLHVNVPHSPFMAQKLIVSADPTTAVIGTFHILPYGWMSRIGNRLLGIWLRPSLKRFDKLLSVSTAAQSFVKDSWGMESQVVPNVVDFNKYASAKPIGKFAGTPNILFLGRLVERKGCQTLLEAVRLLDQDTEVGRFRVLVCGSGHLSARLKKFVNANGLQDIVRFEGYIDEAEKPAYYASSAISVFPSSGGESFGIVLLEAMASGQAAVLGGDNAGYSSVLSPKSELIFPAKDAQRLAEILKDMLQDEQKRLSLANWGAAYAKKFDTAVVGQELLTIYGEVLSKRQKVG